LQTQEGQEQLVGFDLQGRLYVELTDMWQRTREISKFSKKVPTESLLPTNIVLLFIVCRRILT
jgi:hypothetical protein